MSLLVDDVDAVARRAAEFGGTIVERTRASSPAGDFVFCLDPDGVRVEACGSPWTRPDRRLGVGMG